MLDDVRNRLWRAYADAVRRGRRSGSAGPALEALHRPDRDRVDEWNRLTAERHDAYRSAFAVPPDRVAVACVSMRPHRVRDVAANVGRQRDVDVELVFVPAADGFDADELRDAFAGLGRVHVETVAPGTTLGAALNRALDTTDARFVAKFDDDDRYGPNYLADALRAHTYAGAGVVGKHTYYARLAAVDETLLRFPGHEFRYSSTLAGGTLVIDRSRTGDIRFPDVSLGEDRAFVAACHRRGVSTFSADRFNFLQHRGDDNTWVTSDEAFRVGTVPVTGDEAVGIDR